MMLVLHPLAGPAAAAVLALATAAPLPFSEARTSTQAAAEPEVTRTSVGDLLFNRTPLGGPADRNITHQVLKLIRSATPRSTIRVSMYLYNDKDVSHALVAAAAAPRNVRVFVTTNDTKARSRWAAIEPALRRAGGGVVYCGGSCLRHGGADHLKVWLFSRVKFGGETSPRTRVVLDTSQNMFPRQANELNNAWVRYGDAALYDGYASHLDGMYRRTPVSMEFSSGVPENADGTRTTVRFSPRPTAADFVAADVRAVPCARTSAVRVTGSQLWQRPEMRDALIAKRRCGVRVSAVLREDNEQDGERDQGAMDELGAAGIPIAASRPGGCRRPVRCNTAWIHSKLMMLEYTSGGKAHRIAYTGAQNWTSAALTDADESSVRFRWRGPASGVGTADTAFYDAYVRYFGRLWNDIRDIRPRVYGSDAAHFSAVRPTASADQHASVAAASRSGASIVVWEDQPLSAPGQAATHIYARTYLRGRPQGPPCRLSAPGRGTAWSHTAASVGMGDAGNAVVAWRDDPDGDGKGDISLVRIGTGSYTSCPPLTRLARPQPVDAANQTEPSVAVNGRGDYVIAWQTNVSGHSGIRASRYVLNADRRTFTVAPRFRRVHVSNLPGNTGAYSHTLPSVGMSRNGTVSVAWAEDDDGNGEASIALRRFRAGGGPIGGAVRVNSVDAGHQTRPDVAVNANGQSVVAWQERPSRTAPVSQSRVELRTLNANGTLRGSDTRAAACMTPAFACGQDRPDAAIADNGTFVVTWREDEPWRREAAPPDTRRIRSDVWARGFPWSGAAPPGLLPLYRMNFYTANQQNEPALAVRPDNRSLLVAYTDDFDSETGGAGQVHVRANFRT